MKDISKDNVSRLHTLLEDSELITIITHMHPDGDAMGSSLGMLEFLRMLGKEASIVLEDRYPESLAFLADDLYDSSHILRHDTDPEGAVSRIQRSDLILCLDFNAFQRVGTLCPDLEAAGCRKVLIDHHPAPDRNAFELIFSETEISSTAELLYYLLMEMPEIAGDTAKLPPRTARALMTGMTTDTNNFANSVFPSTFRMASALLEAGVDRDSIISEIQNNYRENRYRLMGTLLKDHMKITPDGVAYIVLDSKTAQEHDVQEGETEGFVNLPLGIRSVKMSLLLKEEQDKFRVSIRSKKGVSANLCARTYFSGGGHEQASGGKLMKDSRIDGPESAAAYIEEVTHSFFNPA